MSEDRIAALEVKAEEMVAERWEGDIAREKAKA